MATIVNMHQAKASLSRLVEQALAGEEVIISRNGEPLVRLMPAPKTGKSGGGKNLISPDLDPTDEEIIELFEGPPTPET
jgi:prevent-host-death family protein